MVKITIKISKIQKVPFLGRFNAFPTSITEGWYQKNPFWTKTEPMWQRDNWIDGTCYALSSPLGRCTPEVIEQKSSLSWHNEVEQKQSGLFLLPSTSASFLLIIKLSTSMKSRESIINYKKLISLHLSPRNWVGRWQLESNAYSYLKDNYQPLNTIFPLSLIPETFKRLNVNLLFILFFNQDATFPEQFWAGYNKN